MCPSLTDTYDKAFQHLSLPTTTTPCCQLGHRSSGWCRWRRVWAHCVWHGGRCCGWAWTDAGRSPPDGRKQSGSGWRGTSPGRSCVSHSSSPERHSGVERGGVINDSDSKCILTAHYTSDSQSSSEENALVDFPCRYCSKSYCFVVFFCRILTQVTMFLAVKRCLRDNRR